jgi:hypothetical protein
VIKDVVLIIWSLASGGAAGVLIAYLLVRVMR